MAAYVLFISSIWGLKRCNFKLQFKPFAMLHQSSGDVLLTGASRGSSFSLAVSASVISLGTTLDFKLSLCLLTPSATTADRATAGGVKEPIEISSSYNPHVLPH